MKTTCGIFLINRYNQTVLICHPTNASLSQWSIPKGELEEGDSYKERALKELKGETGIVIEDNDESDVLLIELPFITYPNRKKQLKAWVGITDDCFLSQYDNNLKCTELVDNKFLEIDLYVWAPFRLAFYLMHSSQTSALKYFLKEYESSNFFNN